MEQEIKLVKITKDNLELACSIQNKIFPKENARANYLEQITKAPVRKECNYCIVYLGNIPIGVGGFYSYKIYPNDAWLGWYGILEEYRHKGYGTLTLEKSIELAKDKNYHNFRLYTDEYAKEAHKIYEKKQMLKEEYNREDDQDEYFIAKIYIYSLSLTGDKVKLWDNKYLGLKEQGEKENMFNI